MTISGFENIISIEQFEYCGMINKHEKCMFVCCVKENDVDFFLNLSESDCSFENDDFSFSGHIEEIAVSRDISGITVQVSCIGKTYKFDETVHNRIFQNTEKTLSDILSKIEGMSDVKHESISEKAIKGIILQDNITDWKFIIQMADVHNEYVFTGKNIFIGLSGNDTVELTEDNFIDYKYSLSSNGASLYCRIDKNIELGCCTNFKEKEMFLSAKKYILEHGKYYYEYYFSEKQEQHDELTINNNALLEAKVKENSDPDRMGKIQVEFVSNQIEDCMSDNAMWINGVSMYASKDMGVSSVPAIDDTVLIKIYNGTAIFLGSIRKEAFNESVQGAESKYILFDKDVFIEYSDKTLSIMNNKNKISFSADNMVVEIGDKTQMILEPSKIAIQSEKTAVELSSDLKSSTGKFIVEGENEISISATNVNIKGKSGVSIN